MKKYYLILVALLSLFECQAQLKKLHDFIFNNTDGWAPSCTMVLNGNKLIGMTQSGGKDSIGTIFSIDTNGSGEKILHSFNGTDGAQPTYSSLTIIGNKFYGVAGAGGTNNDGVIFSMDTDGNNYKILFNFNGTNGNAPEGKLAFSGRKLYGTTYVGGANNDGVIFSIDTNGTGYKVLLNFNSGPSGEYPYGCTLTLSGSIFYGTTSNGGKYNSGTIFSIDTSGTIFNTIYNFLDTGALAASSATGQLVLSKNALYGMTTDGGGVGGTGSIFAIHTNGSGFKVLHDFSYGINGENPYNSLVLSGAILYGMSQGGSTSCTSTCGIMFSIDTNGNNYNCLYSFGGSDGAHTVYCGLTLWGGMIYGVTDEGGIDNEGVIFSYKDSAVTTGVNQISVDSRQLSVWPNPTTGITNYELKITNEKCTLEVFNVIGEDICTTTLKSTTGQLDLSNQPVGLYFYRVTSEKGELVGSGKLVIEK